MNSPELSPPKPPRGPLFVAALAAIALVNPLAVHLFLPVIPAVKVALDVSSAVAQLTFSIALFVMAFATLVYGSLADRLAAAPCCCPDCVCSLSAASCRCSPKRR